MPPPSVWLHVDGVSLPSDVHSFQPSVRSYDYQTKHLQSPIHSPTPTLASPAANTSYSISMIDTPFNHHNSNKPHTILENVDAPKKMFKDRQIKKVKSLPGLIKGTALSRNTPSQTSTFTSPAPSAISVNTLQDDQLPMVTIEHSDDGLPMAQVMEPQNEIRRPRVYFADYNRIQFIEENNELSQQHQIPINDEPRHSRVRLSRKISNHTTPSIQRATTRQNFTCPTSRHPCHQTGHESTARKEHLPTTTRIQHSHITNLPDIISQTLPNENSSHEKYGIQREKSVHRSSKPSMTVTNSLAFEISPQANRTSNGRSSPNTDSSHESHKSDSGDSENGQLHVGNGSVSSTATTNRQRPALRTISLRQQFTSPTKPKSSETSSLNNANYHYHQPQQMNRSMPNTQRSNSLKVSSIRIVDNNEDHRLNESSLTLEKRPTSSSNDFNKQSKRSYIVHYNNKKPLGGSTVSHTNDVIRHSTKSHSNESNDENFHSVLTIVRPPYGLGASGSTNKSVGSSADEVRTSRNPNMRAPLEFNMTSNTIIV
ncbi:unnamed protein product [Adineta ricciae]|uniref:Uncharacterized protein n=1 Tax=Adineta ricciae TaxID=249248 RepID=A0A813ZQR0_ADIRI|nr:unnamed protein product [Adineta ricciae]CAF1563987.1 unnamed protein product [Adineta ricciae]